MHSRLLSTFIQAFNANAVHFFRKLPVPYRNLLAFFGFYPPASFFRSVPARPPCVSRAPGAPNPPQAEPNYSTHIDRTTRARSAPHPIAYYPTLVVKSLRLFPVSALWT